MAILLTFLTVSSTLTPLCLGSASIELSSVPANVSYCDRQYSCLNCSTVRVCAPTPDKQHLYEISRFTCDSSYPHCNYSTGSCSSTVDPVCYSANATISTDFICMRDGYFPDPNNCSVYYYCQDDVAYQSTCTSPTPYYHPGEQYCVSTQYYCTNYFSSYRCSYASNFGQKVPIPYTSSYYLVCGTNNNIIAVDRCIGDYYFSSTYQKCRFTCPNKGLFLREDDCASYFKCSLVHGEYILSNMTCPTGQAFLESEFSCVDHSRVPNCNLPGPEFYSK